VTLTARLVGRAARLGPPRHRRVHVERDLAATMGDGAVLLADRWYPAGGHSLPLILLRSPYGRRQLGVVGRLMSERGYQVVIQSCRGTFGSSGSWDPFHHEQADGQATLSWMASQPWFSGQVATFGPSYLGLVQWAVAGDPPPYLSAMAMQVTASRFRDAVVYPGGSFAYETGAVWVHQLAHQELGWGKLLAAQLKAGRALTTVSETLPLEDADMAGIGRRVPYYHDWLAHNRPGDPWWEPLDFGKDVSRLPPTSMVGGWYDIFLPSQVLDFASVVDAGRRARLTIGPWTHTNLAGMGAGLRDGLEWLDSELKGRPLAHPDAVRLYVMGSRRWVGLHGWPPPAAVQRWHLQPGGRLSPDPPAGGGPDRFRYDPADPTPSAGGPSLNWRTSGPRNQRRRESRPDVVCYTSEPLTGDLTVAGPLGVELWLRSSVRHTDVFVRLCRVSAQGVSKNVADGILRIEPGHVNVGTDGVLCVEVPMWPTACTFRRGESVRLQVSSGAHPLFVRNLGSGEPLGTGRTLVAADQEIWRDSTHPSAIVLPVSGI
jgi:putative CocE/NonD family hydrolase